MCFIISAYHRAHGGRERELTRARRRHPTGAHTRTHGGGDWTKICARQRQSGDLRRRVPSTVSGGAGRGLAPRGDCATKRPPRGVGLLGLWPGGPLIVACQAPRAVSERERALARRQLLRGSQRLTAKICSNIEGSSSCAACAFAAGARTRGPPRPRPGPRALGGPPGGRGCRPDICSAARRQGSHAGGRPRGAAPSPPPTSCGMRALQGKQRAKKGAHRGAPLPTGNYQRVETAATGALAPAFSPTAFRGTVLAKHRRDSSHL